MKITRNKKIVESLLRAIPHLRDDDNKLLASVWYEQIKKSGSLPGDLSGYEILKMVADKQLANSESIRRIRQKLQEINPELRGEIYYERHKEKKRVEIELRNFVV
tara:strand:- start:5221 stop:5535 length:315 start_codon:yes stop_codon:yes gene_type:complete